MRLSCLVVGLVVLLGGAGVVGAEVKVEGRRFAESVTVEGRELKLIGAGLREKLLFDIYALGAYTESGRCERGVLVGADERKHLRIDLLMDLPGERLGKSMAEALGRHTPAGASAQLRQQVVTFQGYFQGDYPKGTVISVSYIPGRGTLTLRNGKPLGPPMPGVGFQRLLFDVYFGPKACCAGLLEDIMGHCGTKR